MKGADYLAGGNTGFTSPTAVYDSLIEHLSSARANAVTLHLDLHFVSDIEHLIATARHNKKEENK